MKYSTHIVEALNIGLPRKELFQDKKYITGIVKQSAAGPVRLTKNGFDGDGVGNAKHHGGPDKAVCAYSLEHYEYWERTLGTKLPGAAFGENLTVSGLQEADVCIGDVFRIGTALVQVSQPYPWTPTPASMCFLCALCAFSVPLTLLFELERGAGKRLALAVFLSLHESEYEFYPPLSAFIRVQKTPPFLLGEKLS